MSRKKEITLDWAVEAPFYMRRFCFTAEDLAANRRGEKSPGQKTRIRWEGMMRMVLIAVISTLLYLAFPENIGDLMMIAAVGGALLLLTGGLAYRAETRAVSCIEGLPSLQFTFGLTWVRYLSVGDKLLKLQKSMHYLPIPRDKVFCVYYDHNTNKLLSMEPCLERNRFAGFPRKPN